MRVISVQAVNSGSRGRAKGANRILYLFGRLFVLSSSFVWVERPHGLAIEGASTTSVDRWCSNG